ncbi:hypothetical protein QZM46_08765 [Burkholderia vietnamiensis]|uniref:Uncharacterized protein n=1 Tax=Burkholderia vietnamiensis TaxID=60552 RepID=A0AAW7TCC5_BURVI|nr:MULTISPECIES: hypothetical protein [Burkholderia]MBH9648330.1 hypothetical protein [Burkholderia vietnamiensis]MBR7913796.1 hypothetical protein [Burkholderia vietnamiensis]MBR8003496.1 hypothetical protein [Burkholderia vietnamiensis]MBR8010274.1 hypothetical protein [Burkholderia vietnamiensis]MBR8014681.1 hypothetical protein [Burkholderia vietnamiensis]
MSAGLAPERTVFSRSDSDGPDENADAPDVDQGARHGRPLPRLRGLAAGTLPRGSNVRRADGVFEVPHGKDEVAHLEQLLAHAWCVDTRGWTEDGAIYNIYSAAELYEDKSDPAVDLRLLDIGGGSDGVGPAKAYYARTPVVDLFVTPRVAMRLRELLAVVDQMYEHSPTGRARDRAISNIRRPHENDSEIYERSR